MLGSDAATVARQGEEAHFHDRDADPRARGACSWARAGAADAQAELGCPVDDVLFFAGEATCADGSNATVDGAIASGRRAAHELLQPAGKA